MKLFICAFLILTAYAGDKAPEAKPGEAKRAKRTETTPTKAPASITIPAGAVETEPGVWSWTDAKGQKWIDRKTPFGVSRTEDKPAAVDPAAARRVDAEADAIKAVEDGNTVHFERMGPFGAYKWSRATTGLNEVERKALERARGAGKQE